MINSYYIQKNLPNSEVQEKLLKDKLKAKEAEGYTFEFYKDRKNLKNTHLKLAIAQEASDTEYSLSDINDLVDTLLNSLVDALIREADLRKTKQCKYHYSLEAMAIPWGGEVPKYSGYVLFQPNSKGEDVPAMFYGFILVFFD